MSGAGPGKEAGHPFLVMCEEGWFWLIPIDEKRTSIGLVTDADLCKRAGVQANKMLAWGMARCPAVMKRAANAIGPETNEIISNFSYSCRPFAGPGYFLLGDAATFLDPIFSSGVCLGMLSGREAAIHVQALLKGECSPAAAQRRYIKFIEHGTGVFFRIINQYYTQSFRELFLNGVGPVRVHSAVLSVLAGQVFPKTPWSLQWRLWLFAMFMRINRFVPLVPKRAPFSLLAQDPAGRLGNGADDVNAYPLSMRIPMALRLIEKLHAHARQRPNDFAIRQVVPDNGHAIRWGELAERVNLLQAILRHEFPAGSTLLLCSTNRPEYTVAFLAMLSAGMTVFPVAPDIARVELQSAAERCGAAGAIAIGQPAFPVGDAFFEPFSLPECGADARLYRVQAWPARTGDGPALLLLSSGTTGRPKIVRRDGASLDAVSANMVEAIGFTPADHVLAAVPLCHSYGMEHGLLCPTWAGSCAHLYEHFDLPAALEQLTGDQGVTIFPGVPFMFEMLCGSQSRGRITHPRRAYSAGGPLPRALFDTFLARFGVAIAQLYGATEIGSVTFNDPALAPFDPASVGRPMSGVSIRILDAGSPDIRQPLPIGHEGHVAVESPSMLSGYINDENPPLISGHFLTGDLGRLDATGALTVTGRIKLLIDVAGRKVNPMEVEQVIASHPSVGECVVVPLRITQTLCRLKAIVTPADADHPPTARDLREFARSRLSVYKIPRVFEVRPSLPRHGRRKGDAASAGVTWTTRE